MAAEHKDEEAIFKAAFKLKSPTERIAYLKRACGNDAGLLARVEGLLKAYNEAGNFLESPPVDIDGALDNRPLTEGPGTKIGRYKLLQLIGEGGFGVVYMAEQEKPIRRRVALKIIKLGMDTKQVIARFEAERQALALMDHSNIARVLDAGATDTGRPYFVMELVKGIPITEYCDKNSLDTRQRLELFIEVCKAVQHAHQKGIIHRDIKPTNVMITLHDGKPVPKIIDFGIAKATQQRLTEKTLFTEYKRFIGTPAYMSPEQAEISGLDIDTRSDIYSLGVLLYELLTGSTPLEAKKLRSAAYDEMCRMIRETDPPKPSTRLSTLGEMLAEVAKQRHAQPSELFKIVRGDLDWVVMKTLEKDRTRRYETANELAMDIERHLRDEPVVAGPPSAMYRMKKFVRRNRTGVLFCITVAAALLVGLCLATVGFVQASRERDRTHQARDRTHQARERAEANFQMARDAVDEMTQVAEQKLANAPGMEQVRHELLQKAQVFYHGFLEENKDDPAAREEIGRAYERLGNIHFRALGQFEQAVEAYQNALNVFVSLARDYPTVDEHAIEIVFIADEYGNALLQGGIHKEAPDTVRALTATLENLVRQFPDQSLYRQAVVDSCQRWETARDLQLDLLEHGISLFESLSAEHPACLYELAKALNDLWRVLKDQGLQEEADRAYQRAEAVRAELVALLPNLPYESRRTCMPWAKGAMCSVEYEVRIKTVGDYQLFVRCDAHDSPSDSFYAWIEQSADGPGGTIVDWYTYGVAPGLGMWDADFASFGWQGSADFEATEMRREDELIAVWSISAPGDYTITLAGREDGIAIDAFIFQLASLPAPEGDGPAESERSEGMVFLERDGRVVVEAEHFASRTALTRNWLVVPDEDAGDVAHRNFRGTGYVQVLPDRTPHPAAWMIWVARGELQRKLGNWDQAVADYSKAIELKPDNSHYWHRRGSVYGQKRQLDKALADYSKAIELDPNRSYHWYSRAVTYSNMNQWDKAPADYSKAIELDPNHYIAWHARALSFLGAGDTKGYRESCEGMLKQFGQTEAPKIARWVAWTCVLAPDAVEDLGQAVKLAEQGAGRDDKSDPYTTILETTELCAILYRAGRFDDVVRQLSTLTRAWEQGRGSSSGTPPSCTWFFLAMAHHQVEHLEEARKCLDKAIERAEKELAEGANWNRKLILQLFRTEAEELLGVNKQSVPNKEVVPEGER
ncbi:MAG: protein kinase domain-containing protein [Planctomycetota bacterium]|jgi:tetratricopeptide (TPR) repeat protein